jgi:hypothetical protein
MDDEVIAFDPEFCKDLLGYVFGPGPVMNVPVDDIAHKSIMQFKQLLDRIHLMISG